MNHKVNISPVNFVALTSSGYSLAFPPKCHHFCIRKGGVCFEPHKYTAAAAEKNSLASIKTVSVLFSQFLIFFCFPSHMLLLSCPPPWSGEKPAAYGKLCGNYKQNTSHFKAAAHKHLGVFFSLFFFFFPPTFPRAWRYCNFISEGPG